MKKPLVVTNIRLPKEDLLEYRAMALGEAKSFPAWVRDVMQQYGKAKKKQEARRT